MRYPALKIAVGVACAGAALAFALTRQDAPAGHPPRQGAASVAASSGNGGNASGDGAAAAAQRIAALEAQLADEVERRQALQERIDSLASEIDSLREGIVPAGPTAHPGADGPPAGEGSAPGTRDAVDYTKSAMQRALESAGLDEATAEGIKLRGDQLAMTEMYLRDQATREGWLDTPRFREEMKDIESQRTSIRDEIGDDAYDRYLFALGHTNRVIVNDVMFDSVAEDVGLQEGDLILRYGDTRIFAPDELVASTHGGPLGESVLVEIVRGGEHMQIEVPRGPLGLRIGPAQDDPDV